MKSQDPGVRLGQLIRAAREEVGLSQAQLAKELGYESGTAVSLIEKGKRKVKTEALRRVAGTLHKDVRYFLGEESPAVDIKVALRADKDLTEDDKRAVLHFIELAKKRHGR